MADVDLLAGRDHGTAYVAPTTDTTVDLLDGRDVGVPYVDTVATVDLLAGRDVGAPLPAGQQLLHVRLAGRGAVPVQRLPSRTQPYLAWVVDDGAGPRLCPPRPPA